MPTDNWPDIRAQHHQRDFPFFEILLVYDVLVSGDDYFEPSCFGGLKEFAVADSLPASFVHSFNLMLAEKLAHSMRDILIEEDAQGRGAFPRNSAIPE